MKKVLALILVGVLCLSLCACMPKRIKNEDTTQPPVSTPEKEPEENAAKLVEKEKALLDPTTIEEDETFLTEINKYAEAYKAVIELFVKYPDNQEIIKAKDTIAESLDTWVKEGERKLSDLKVEGEAGGDMEAYNKFKEKYVNALNTIHAALKKEMDVLNQKAA